MSKKIKLSLPKKDCFFCFEFPFGEFTEEQIKMCAEHWMDAENCPNWKPPDAYIEKRRKLKKVIWISDSLRKNENRKVLNYIRKVERKEKNSKYK